VDTLFRVDTVEDGGFLLAVEAQGQPDPDKPNSWTYYLAHLYAKYRLPPILLVVCRDKATASWAAEPVRVGVPVRTSMAVFPLVLGPGNVPTVTDPDEATEDLALAILDALAAAVANTGGEIAKRWAEYTEIGLDDTPARAPWRHLMATYTPRFPGSGTLIEETLNAGEAKGRAADILRILDRRGIEIPEDARERITSCTDLDVLGTWFDRSLTVTNTEELFMEE
jgi:hypothetical protein